MPSKSETRKSGGTGGTGGSSDDASDNVDAKSQKREEPKVVNGEKDALLNEASPGDGKGDGAGASAISISNGTDRPAEQEHPSAESSTNARDSREGVSDRENTARKHAPEQKAESAAKEGDGEYTKTKGEERPQKDPVDESAKGNDGNATSADGNGVDSRGQQQQESVESARPSCCASDGDLSRVSNAPASQRNGRPAAAAAPAADLSHSAILDRFTDNDHASDQQDTLLTMSFNQDGGCLAVGTGSGFRICNAHPFQETFRRQLGGDAAAGADEGGGIAHIEMLYRTNLLALTGHAHSPTYPPNKVMIYDDHLQRPIGELIFRQRVLATRLRRDRIVVVLRDRVYVYNFSDLALLDKVHTGDNPLGLIGISTDNGGVGGSTVSASAPSDKASDDDGAAARHQQHNNGMVLACPGTTQGQVGYNVYHCAISLLFIVYSSSVSVILLPFLSPRSAWSFTVSGERPQCRRTSRGWARWHLAWTGRFSPLLVSEGRLSDCSTRGG